MVQTRGQKVRVRRRGELLGIRNMKPKLAIFYKETRLLVKGLEHQMSHKTFSLQFVLPARCGE